MDTPDLITYMVEFIKTHDYPQVHTMNHEEMADIFHLSNRCFLVCWALTLLDKAYAELLKGREQDKGFLADLVRSHGFCAERSKSHFINGELPLVQQTEILYRMFRFIERQKEAEALSVTNNKVTLEDLCALKNKNLNLFPAFGEIKTFSEQERQIKIKQIQAKIESLKLEKEKVREQNSPVKVSDIEREHIREIIKDINKNLSQFDEVINTVNRNDSLKTHPCYQIDPASTELLQTCNEYLKITTQYIADLKTINEFVIEDFELPIQEITPMIKMLAEQLQDMGL